MRLGGSFPWVPLEWNHCAHSGPSWPPAALEGKHVAGKVKRCSVPSFCQATSWFSLAAMRVKARLRSISCTSAWIPIFRHCSRIISAICVNW